MADNRWIAGKIEQWPVGKLKPYAGNARTHSEAQIAQIAASITEFGFVNPLLVGSDGTIVAGHGRLAAAKKIGLEVVPVVVLDHLTPTQRRALVIADNRIAENAAWDEEQLLKELDELQDEGWSLDDLGFSGSDLDAMIGDMSVAEEASTPIDANAASTLDSDDTASEASREKTIYTLLLYLRRKQWERWIDLKKRRGLSDDAELLDELMERAYD